ncbi:MAG: FHA domain-containing protein [Myxococcaceae bacterium]
MKSYLLSTLTARLAGGDVETFRAAHPHDWLIWEPGAWRPPNRTTLIVASGVSDPNKTGEALALAMEPKKGEPGQVTLGRGDDCAITINDGTLSQLHLTFMKTPEGTWTIRDAGSKNGSKLDGLKLEPGQPWPMRSGARIQAAQVQFTFLSPEGLVSRLMTG